MNELQNQMKTHLDEEKKHQTQINDLTKENKQLNEKIKNLNDEKQKMNSQINDLTKENKQLHEQIRNFNDEKLKTKNDDQINQEKNENIINIDQKQDGGIIQYFDQKTSQMPDKEFIQIFAKIGSHFRNVFKNLKKSVAGADLFQYYDLFKDDEWDIFDFKENFIEISSYSIKSSRFGKDCTHIKSWSIDISNDGKNWETIDEHLDSSELNGPNITKTFKVLPKKFARFARLMNRSDCYGKDKGYVPEISHIEFYGRIKTPQ